jgi:hypothetical protein
MSVEISSAEDLFNLLAGDDIEVPEELIRGSSKRSAQDRALDDQAQIARLNKVEEWMEKEDSITSDPSGFVSVGESLVQSLFDAPVNAVGLSVIQKLTKLCLVWLKVTKSCRLLESSITIEVVLHLVELFFAHSTRLTSKPALEACTRVISTMITVAGFESNPSLLQLCNKYIQSWKKLKRVSETLSVLPAALLGHCTFHTSGKEFVDIQILDFVEKLLKKKHSPVIDFPSFIATCSSKDGEVRILKSIACALRSVKYPICTECKSWVTGVSDRDTTKPGVSVKTVTLANQIKKEFAGIW